jgi:amino acid transporter
MMGESQNDQEKALGLGGAWAMAVGGMIGGGIFSTLGVVVSVAGEWAWLSFLIGGAIAFCSGHSYAELTVKRDSSGGSYGFLRDLGYMRSARMLVWTMISGYVLTVAVYGFTFGAYAANALSLPEWAAPAASLGAITILAAVNLMGASEATMVELIAVWGKLLILLGLAGIGLWRWRPDALLTTSVETAGPLGAIAGVGVVFMAYEGFQLLSYDYDEMRDAKRTIRLAIGLSIGATCLTYVLVALGATMLTGADAIIAREEVALAEAGRAALGTSGFVAVTIAATFSTASAINATVFATARLARSAADDGELPRLFGRCNNRGVPWAGVLIISSFAMALSVFGGIAQLVESASFVFLLVFSLVNALAWRAEVPHRWLSGAGALASLLGGIILASYDGGLL